MYWGLAVALATWYNSIEVGFLKRRKIHTSFLLGNRFNLAVGINTSYAEFKKMLLSQQYLDNVPELLSIIYRETEDKQFSWNDLEKYLEEKLYDKAFTENLEKYKEIKFCKIENRLTNFLQRQEDRITSFSKDIEFVK